MPNLKGACQACFRRLWRQKQAKPTPIVIARPVLAIHHDESTYNDDWIMGHHRMMDYKDKPCNDGRRTGPLTGEIRITATVAEADM